MVTSLSFPPEEGIGYYVWNLARQLISKGHTVRIITRGGAAQLTCERLDDITIWRPTFAPLYPFHVHVHGLFVNHLVSRLEGKVDVFHAHSPLPSPLRTQRPVLLTVHTPMRTDARGLSVRDIHSLLIKLQSPVSYHIERRLLRSAAQVATVAHSVAHELQEYGVDPVEVAVLGNGVDDVRFAANGIEPAHPPYVLAAGRLEQRKGFQDLVECARLVCQGHPDVQFLIAGKGPMEGALRAAIDRAGLKGRVILLGHVAERSRMVELYQRATLFAHAAHREGLPTVMLEAMACSRPVVSTAVSGALDVVISGENGLLVSPRDPAQMAEAIKGLLGDPSRCTRLGQAARRTIETRFSWDIVSDNYIKVYEQLSTVEGAPLDMKVAIISSCFQEKWLRLQPHRTLLEIGRQLSFFGHDVTMISDGAPGLPEQDGVCGLRLRRVCSVRLFRGRQNPALFSVVDQESPDMILWHLGLSSFIHQDLQHPFSPKTVGVLTSPIHRPREILRLGSRRLLWDPDVVSIHLAGALAPGWLIRRAFSTDGLLGMITLSETTRLYLIDKGAPAGRVWVVPPGVNREWLNAALSKDDRRSLRCRLGFREGDFVATYFGSPSPIRGLYTLLQAAERTMQSKPQLRLLILSRRRSDEREQQANYLNGFINRNGLGERVRVVDGFLGQEDLMQHIMAGDAVCLPFELVPSDVPLSILEAMALGQGIITTNVACIPELVGQDRGFMVPAASVGALAQQLRAVIETPDMIQARGQNGRNYVESHRTWEGTGEFLERVLTTGVRR